MGRTLLRGNMDFHLTQDKNEYLIKPLTNKKRIYKEIQEYV